MARRYYNRSGISVLLPALIVLLTAAAGILTFRFFRDVHRNRAWKECFISLGILFLINFGLYHLSQVTATEVFVCGLIVTFTGFCIYWHKMFSYLNPRANAVLRREREYWWSLDGWQFEEEVANVFRLYGYKVKVTKKSGDGGVDLIMKRNGYTSIVQCKHYRNSAPPEPLRALWGVKDDFMADEVIMVASSGITQSGIDFIQNKPNFRVLDLDDIIIMSKQAEEVKSGE